MQQANQWVEHTLTVNTQLEVVGSLIKDAETGQRGYLLTGQQRYLQPYQTALLQLPEALKMLGDMTSDNPEQVRSLEKLQQLIGSKLRELKTTIDLYDQGHAEAARAIVQSNLGKNDMDEIRMVLARMDATERILLNRREQSLRGVEFRERAALLLGLFISLLAVIAFGWALYRIELVRERATAAIVESEEWLSTTLASIGDAVIATDATGSVRFLNRVAQDLTQYSQSAAQGQPLRKVFPIFNELTRAEAESPVEKAIRTGAVVGLANHTVLVRPDGSEIAIDDSAAPILDRQGRISGVVLVFRNVSEQRAIEKAMRTSEKLAATGRLAATVAHEINNPLEAAANLIYLMRDDSTLSPEGKQYLKLAEEQLSRVAHITKQTLSFYRDPRRPEPLSLSSVCDRLIEIYRPRFHNKAIQLQVHYEKGLVVVGTEGELAQVVSNLLTNALDATAHNGAVDISVSRVDHHGVITVSDTGYGIAPANLTKIFEPFFTTKKDVGTGLGLWVSKEIVEKLGGKIEVASSGENQGARFSVCLPLYEANTTGEAG